MDEHPAGERADEGLQELLAVEQRLEDLVRAAQDDAARRVTAARAAKALRLAAACDAAEQADRARAGEARVAHEQALMAIETAHRAALAAIAALSDERVDDLARWALDQAMGMNGEPA